MKGFSEPTEHHFLIEDAVRFGVQKAILLYNIKYWLKTNAANNKNKHHGCYWMYNSSSSFAKLFPYLKKSSIGRWLRELEDEGVIFSTDEFNEKPYDNTKWYTIPALYLTAQNEQGSDETPAQILTTPAQNEQTPAQNEQPIPDNKLQIENKNNKQYTQEAEKAAKATLSDAELRPTYQLKSNEPRYKSKYLDKFHDTYVELKGMKPEWTAKEIKAIHMISNKFYKIFEGHVQPINLQQELEWFTVFLNRVNNLKWYNTNFTPTIINSKWNEITQELKGNKDKQQGNGRESFDDKARRFAEGLG